MADLPSHPTTIDLLVPFPSEVPAGIDIALTVRVSCLSGCDHRGLPVQIMQGGEVVGSRDLSLFRDGINETSGFTLKAPAQAGAFAWQIVFPRHHGETCLHEEAVVPISFATKPHATSMAVWDVPSPVVMNSGFTVKVGVKCSVECRLTGRIVEIHDEHGMTRGASRLADLPLRETSSLYWAAVELTAPSTEGSRLWTATFRQTEPELPHDDSSTTFSFCAAKPPEIRISTRVVVKDTGLPLQDTEVRLGTYEAFTDPCGQAVFNVPRGAYGLTIRKDGYSADPLPVQALEDAFVRVEVATTPPHSQLVEMMKRFEGEYWRP